MWDSNYFSGFYKRSINAGTWKSTMKSRCCVWRCDVTMSNSIQDGGALVVKIYWFSIFACSYSIARIKEKHYFFALIKVSTFTCKREILGCSSLLTLKEQFFLPTPCSTPAALRSSSSTIGTCKQEHCFSIQTHRTLVAWGSTVHTVIYFYLVDTVTVWTENHYIFHKRCKTYFMNNSKCKSFTLAGIYPVK